VGFYGGINYGFGYGGIGFGGGEWRGGSFFYNRAVMHVDEHNVTNVYNRSVVVNNTHVAFNGPGGVEARPTAQEEAYGHESHSAALAAQTEHEHAASQNRQLFASENHGRPAIAATGKPGEFSGRDVSRAREAGGAYHEPKMSPQEARGSGGNRGEARNERSGNEAGRSGERSNDRPARAENREARNKEARGNEGRGNEARNNEARSNKERNSEAGNRGQKAAHENSKPAKQEKQAQKHEQKQSKPAKQAKSEPKHEGRR
jgi:hypothetical protein